MSIYFSSSCLLEACLGWLKPLLGALLFIMQCNSCKIVSSEKLRKWGGEAEHKLRVLLDLKEKKFFFHTITKSENRHRDGRF